MSFHSIEHVYEQQITREQLARTRQAVEEMRLHYDNYEQQVRLMQNNIKTDEDAVRYSSLLLELNRGRDNLNRHINSYNEMVRIANLSFTSRLSDIAKREIYHLYHSGRYTQDQLAAHYGIQQGTVSKIVNGQPPSPI
ncbi:hypothetical protein IG611_01350 [Pectobacterium sp. A535-S3-A17]|uniref:hypothetical protein n=1 Tax=Pectobacterium quasiaquaticum TaxID=2774015 RepID=UPI0018748C40|nr:hypothetical protein [Pectobacterium quasiaquaticum]MBE5213312.1 hypothetical protein [Pectobacterium quasiaquaticum]MBE5224038.1 hypothetical protein [Pectobacterium quasiaquaticum]